MFAATTKARYNHLPREGHLKTMLRVFGYLKSHQKGAIRFDLTVPEDVTREVPLMQKEMYPDAVEKVPKEYPLPKGKGVLPTAEVDADHAHDLETRRSVTGVILFMNNTPVKWYSKRQHTVETSTYDSEIVAARIALELIMEYPIIGKSRISDDNKSVITNISVSFSMLKKKHHACTYHFLREAAAADIVEYFHIPSNKNKADALTKALPPHVLYELMKGLMFNKEKGGT